MGEYIYCRISYHTAVRNFRAPTVIPASTVQGPRAAPRNQSSIQATVHIKEAARKYVVSVGSISRVPASQMTRQLRHICISIPRDATVRWVVTVS